MQVTRPAAGVGEVSHAVEVLGRRMLQRADGVAVAIVGKVIDGLRVKRQAGTERQDKPRSRETRGDGRAGDHWQTCNGR